MRLAMLMLTGLSALLMRRSMVIPDTLTPRNVNFSSQGSHRQKNSNFAG
jgi:hypothetical protein